MAYTSCAAAVAANIVKDCDHPEVGKYTGRAVLIPLDEYPVIAVSGTNTRMLTSIAPATGKKTIALDNVMTTPFDGSNTVSNEDGGVKMFVKTLAFRVQQRGAKISKDIIDALCSSPRGYIAVVEKQDQVGDGTYEVIGYGQGLKVNADGVSRNENENNGNTMITMSCQEPYFEYALFDTDLATTAAMFDDLFTNQSI